MRGLAALDLRLLRLLRTRGHSPPVEAATISLARSGENGLVWYVIALAGAALDRRGDREAYFRAVKIVLATLVANTVIKQTVRLKESPAAGLSILEYDRNSDVARAYMQLAQEVAVA